MDSFINWADSQTWWVQMIFVAFVITIMTIIVVFILIFIAQVWSNDASYYSILAKTKRVLRTLFEILFQLQLRG